MNDFSVDRLTLVLLLHYLGKVKSRSLPFTTMNSCCTVHESGHIVTNMSNRYYFSKSQMCHIASCLLQHVLKMFACSTNVSGRR